MKTYLATDVAAMVDVPYSTLMRWLSQGLLNPTNARQGQSIQTYWGAKDVREASVLANLRRAGFSLQRLRRAMEYLRSVGHNPFSSGQFIAITKADGEPADIVKVVNEQEAIELLRHPGQLVMRLWSEDRGD